MKTQFKTPILLLTFNRPENTKKVFKAIKKIKPRKLFVAQDGPRPGNKSDKALCKEVRKIIKPDWPCEIKTLFRKENMGCKAAVESAITWFFQEVPQGIILEDDCLPKESFFRFCEEMLNKYKDQRKVLSITGYNYLNTSEIEDSYYFSRYFECWGWATWKRAWNLYDGKMKDYKKSGRIFFNKIEKMMYNKRFKENMVKERGSWATHFLYTHFKENAYCITPKYSVIKNLGLSGDYTHTRENRIGQKFFDTQIKDAPQILKHPKKITPIKRLTRRYISKEFFRILLKKINFLDAT